MILSLRSLLLVLLVVPLLSIGASAQATPFDTSKAVTVNEVFRWPMSGSTASPSYYRNYSGIPNLNVVMFSISTGRLAVWRTYPVLDTTTPRNATRSGTSMGVPFDYDGIPPLEHVDYFSKIWRNPDPTTPFQWEQCDAIYRCMRYGDHELADVDGDGVLDIVGESSRDQESFAVAFGGKDRGVGCKRVRALPPIQPGLFIRDVSRLIRCSDGHTRIYTSRSADHRNLRRCLYLFDVNIERIDTAYDISYTVSDSIVVELDSTNSSNWIMEPNIVVDDTLHGKQYALCRWQASYLKDKDAWVVYDITNGKFIEREYNTDTFFGSPGWFTSFGNTFDDGHAVVRYSKGQYLYYARITDLFTPFARYAPRHGPSDQVFIDDQTGDGRRDLLTVSTRHDTLGWVALADFNLGTTGATTAQPAASVRSWLDGNQLRLILDRPLSVSIDIVDLLGRTWPVLSDVMTRAGTSSIDLTTVPNVLPAGLYLIHVHTDTFSTTIKYLHIPS